MQLLSGGAERVIPYIPRGVTLCNARGANDPAVADWTVGVIIAQLRMLRRFIVGRQAARWDSPSGELGDLVEGKHVLIVGYGSIGAAVEHRLVGFGVTVERIARHPRPGVLGMAELPAALPRADVVILLVPVTPETKSMVDAKFLAAMKDRALLVNAARGAVVDIGALLAELSCGPVASALPST